jgi:protein-S-isoprenylcysteine O-methyltransferase Ste14
VSEQSIIVLIILWMVYFVLHSILASVRVKKYVARHWPGLMPWYRLIFNAVATITLAPPLYVLFRYQGTTLWTWQGPWFFIANGLALAAIAGFLVSLRYYDGSEFLGLNQLRNHTHAVKDLESFQLSPLHRLVRHPWYALALVLIWTRDMNPAFLVTALLLSVYFILGLRLEEKKLLLYHGDIYRLYREKVPALVPLPWRYLTRAEADELLKLDSQN